MKVTRTHYDVIVIDCPPNLGNLTLNALMASDSVLIPCDMSVLSLEGVSDILETVDTLDESLGHNLRVLGILRTRFDRRNQKVNQTVESSLKERHGALVLNTRIPVNTRLSQAQNAGQPIFQFDPDCRGLPQLNTCYSLRTDGILWSRDSQDYSSNVTGSSLFDR